MQYYDRHKSKGQTQYSAETIDGKLIINLRDISHTMRGLYEGKGSQKRILIVLNQTKTITQRALTARLGIQPSSASEVIAKLERTGLVKRTSSEEDRRTADITLTEEGRRKAEDALEQRKRRHEEMFSVLSQREKEQLLTLLEKVNADWQKRYGEQRKHLGEKHHGGDFECHADDTGREEEDCHDHDCANCVRPCGKFRNRQA